ncbi:DUF4192 domain-containing protein [Amycolatopsis cihanbeyliensis]|uniref:Uncharacterized protein DUF4192 n=1 Tax=Amycolatopsis cihanbeyliensis TaxID=1128664 RepID=A0A542DFW5_AMYCI|nr:DUF4192 domain-containing protein [Amycolatopsis cihanbeyliensis]TQJ01950.1 uncharacterized protein DUF4192 [Amycolatopsis cihanbeyliensis]
MTTTTAVSEIKIKLRDPAQLLAATPALLGFRPEDSLVLIAHAMPRGDRIGLVLRGDLPPPGHEHELARHLAAPLVADGAVGVTVVVVGRHPGESEDGSARVVHSTLVDAVSAVLGEWGMRTMHALWVPRIEKGARYHCYVDSTCTGVLPEPTTTAAAAAVASAGQVTFGSREAMERLLAPVEDDVLARRSERLTAACEESADPDTRTERHCREVCGALGELARGELGLDDDRVVALARALSDTRVRDACLTTVLPRGSHRSLVAEQLWLRLIREVPAPERAEAACLLGYSAYMRGEGALAGMAFDSALRADPAHVLSGLMVRALRAGMPPARLLTLAEAEDVLDLERPFGRATAPRGPG